MGRCWRSFFSEVFPLLWPFFEAPVEDPFNTKARLIAFLEQPTSQGVPLKQLAKLAYEEILKTILIQEVCPRLKNKLLFVQYNGENRAYFNKLATYDWGISNLTKESWPVSKRKSKWRNALYLFKMDELKPFAEEYLGDNTMRDPGRIAVKGSTFTTYSKAFSEIPAGVWHNQGSNRLQILYFRFERVPRRVAGGVT